MAVKISGKLPETASFHVDCQKGFSPGCSNELPVPGGDEIVGELLSQDAFAAYRVGSKDAHPSNALWVTKNRSQIATPVDSKVAGPDLDLKWPIHCMPGTKGFELLDGLSNPMSYNYFVYKGVERDVHPYGACYHDLAERVSTGVIEWLKCHNVVVVIVGGLATDYCAGLTAIQLRKAGFQVIFNLGAARGIDPQSTKKKIDEMKSMGIVVVDNAASIPAALERLK